MLCAAGHSSCTGSHWRVCLEGNVFPNLASVVVAKVTRVVWWQLWRDGVSRLTTSTTSGDRLQLIFSKIASTPSLQVSLSIRAKLSLHVLVLGPSGIEVTWVMGG